MPIERERKCIELRPCPFCGASGHTYLRKYPNGDVNPATIMWHDEDFPLKHMLEALADAWNRRWKDA